MKLQEEKRLKCRRINYSIVYFFGDFFWMKNRTNNKLFLLLMP